MTMPGPRNRTSVGGGVPDGTAELRHPSRSTRRRRALGLEYFTIGWNVLEGAVAIGAAAAASSVALFGFGVDSFVESASAAILVWRLRAENGARDAAQVEELDRRAQRLVALALFALAAYVAIDAMLAFGLGRRPEASPVGIALLVLSIAVMWWLARAKRRAARSLGSRALEADAFQTTACWWLSIVTLGGIGANAALGWWWADPLAALGLSGLVVREGREIWRGEACCP